MSSSSVLKIAIVSILGFFVFFYSNYYQNKYDKLDQMGNEFILRTLPSFEVDSVKKSDGLISKESIYKDGIDGLFVHFWGTWCPPCIEELPDLFSYAKGLEKNKKIKFLLIASRDERKKVLKFIKKYKTIPSNIILALDENGDRMIRFGTVKVPETFLFDKSGKILYRFVGSQSWANKTLQEKINELIYLK